MNGAWEHKTEIPAHLSSFGAGEEVEARVDRLLWAEVKACLAGRRGGGAGPAAIATLARSCLVPSVQATNCATLKEAILSSATVSPGLALGLALRRGVPSLLELVVDVRSGGTKRLGADYRVYVDPGTFGLPSLEYYKRSSVVAAYVKCIREACEKLGVPDLSPAVRDETVAWAGLAKAINKEPETVVYTWQGLRKAFENIPWSEILIGWGCGEGACSRTTFEVSNPPWLAALDALCSKGGGLGGLVALHCLVHGLPYLPPPFDALHSSFFEGVLEGQTRKLPQHVLALDAIKEHLPAALGALYVARHVPAGFRAQATQFVRRIRDAAAVAVARSQWLSGAARAEAGRKLAAMRLSVGYADPRPEGAGARALRPETFLENIYTLHSEKVDRLLGRLEHGMPGDSWDDAPFLVNAYYYTNTNEIVIPVANFSEPFFRAGGTGAAAAWNYGGLGAAIAHEITHAFDTDGQRLNSRGRKRQWWSARNQRGLRHRQGRLMVIYDAEGINGKATLDENLADLGGLEIALAAAKAAGALETPAAVREFFTAYAVSWRTKEQGAKKRQRLLADKHAPVEARVNLIVSQFDEWYEAFGVGPSCRLYREPRTRLRLFRE